MSTKSNQNNKLDILRHSASHILAAAVLEMFPEAKFGIGPTIEGGFYYDFDLPRTLIPEDLPLLEEKMRAIIKQNFSFERQEIEAKKTQKLFDKAGQPYKVELIRKLSKQETSKQVASKNKKAEKLVTKHLPLVTIYKTGGFVDLCRGPHLDSTGEIKTDAFKLLKIAGAYWRGSEKNKMLQRVYGTAFETKKELDEYFKKLEEAEKRDHRKLGKELDLFSSHDEVGAGIFLWHPKASVIRTVIEDFWRIEHSRRGYQYVFTPHIGKLELWKISGHWNFYRENMYTPMITPEGEYMIKPMNCPFHILIYKTKPRSYKDLPIRYGELGTVYRFERAGTLHGLLRVRSFTQDDAHIFCRQDQLLDEIIGVLDLALFMLNSFGFKEYKIELSTRDPKEKKKYMGDDKVWDKAEKALANALETKKLKYKIMPGEAKFYGPAIDIKLIDALGRGWQGPTIQLDFNLAKNFDVNYIDQKGKPQQAIILHRTVLGCMERFLGCLIEHYAGAFPVWLAPEQVWILSIGSRHEEYAFKVAEKLKSENIRVAVKNENETIGKKIREGELQKIPYLLVVGDKEIAADSVAVRERGKGDLGPMKVDKFIEKILNEIKNKN